MRLVSLVLMVIGAILVAGGSFRIYVAVVILYFAVWLLIETQREEDSVKPQTSDESEV